MAAGRGAAGALVQGNAGLTVVEVPDPLPAIGGTALLLGHGMALTLAGAVTTLRRDVT